MRRFAEVCPDREIVDALSKQWGWTDVRRLIYIDDPREREFYAEMSRIERWSTRTRAASIALMLYERMVPSRRPEEVIDAALAPLRDEDRMSPEMVCKDP